MQTLQELMETGREASENTSDLLRYIISQALNGDEIDLDVLRRQQEFASILEEKVDDRDLDAVFVWSPITEGPDKTETYRTIKGFIATVLANTYYNPSWWAPAIIGMINDTFGTDFQNEPHAQSAHSTRANLRAFLTDSVHPHLPESVITQ